MYSQRALTFERRIMKKVTEFCPLSVTVLVPFDSCEGFLLIAMSALTFIIIWFTPNFRFLQSFGLLVIV